MGNIGTIYSKIGMDVSELDRASVKVRQFTDTTDRQFTKASAATSSFQGALSGIMATLSLAATARSTYGIVKMASDLEEATNKFQVVFRGSLDEANASVEDLTANYGMAKTEAIGYMAAVQDLLVPMGLARDKAALLSGEIVRLSADLGSFNNVGTADVMMDIESALVGNYETMKKYGIVIRDTIVQEKAMAMGFGKTKAELTTSEKALAAYKLMVENSSDALGDFKRTSDSYANTEKRLVAAVRNIGAALGAAILPAVTNIANEWTRWAQAISDVLTLTGPRKDLQVLESMLKDLNTQLLMYQKIATAGTGEFGSPEQVQQAMVNLRSQIKNVTGSIETLKKQMEETGKVAAVTVEDLAGDGTGGENKWEKLDKVIKRIKDDFAGHDGLEEAINAAVDASDALAAHMWKVEQGLAFLPEAKKAMEERAAAEMYRYEQLEIMQNNAAGGMVMFIDESEDKWKTAMDDMKNATQGWAASWSSSLNDMLWNADATFGDILMSFGKMITQMIIQTQFIEPLFAAGTEAVKSSGGEGILGGIFSKIFGFSKGGIISRPTIFPMANGMGLAGERGSEGIFPLERDARGRLGVIGVANANDTVVNIQITNTTGAKTQATEAKRAAGGRDIKILIGEMVGADISSGGPVSKSLRETYGLVPQVGGR